MTLEELRAALKAKIEEHKSLTKAVSAEDVSAEDVDALEKASGEIEALEKRIAAIEKAERIAARNATKANDPVNAGEADGGDEVQAPAVRKRSYRKAGSKFGRYVRCMYIGHNDPDEAAKIAKSQFGDEEVAAYIEDSDLGDGFGRKSMTSNDFDAGGAFVPSDLSSSVIERLQARAAVRRAGATVVDLPRGTLEYPKVTAGASGHWVGEAQASNAESVSTGSVKLTWKKLVAKVPISKELLMFGGAGVESTVERDTLRSLINTEDQAFLRGAGSEYAPRGLRYRALAANVFATAGVTAANAEADFRKMLENLEGANVIMDPDEAAAFMSTRSRGFLATLRESAGGNRVFPDIRGSNPSIMDAQAIVSNNVPNNLSTNKSEIIMAYMPDVLIGQATEMEVELLENVSYTDATGTLVSTTDLDQVLLKVTNRVDLQVRHEEAITVMTDVAYGA